ncbi:MAG TPA: hypothetical protein VG013_23145 [Gemmataceae bacterium]|nr:hypothetical protein [Gemmataceae bacterium]
MLKSFRLRLLLLVAAFVLFAVWIGRLAYLALHKPVILARTEFLVADVVVIARLDNPDGPATVQAVCWPQDPKALEDKGLTWQPGDKLEIKVTNLERCRGDWTGPGEYIVPLFRADKAFEVANPTGYSQAQVEQQRREGQPPHSVSPGYYPGPPGDKNIPPPRIYRANRETEAQVEQIFGKPCRR